MPPLHLLPGMNRKPQVPKIEQPGVEAIIPHQTKTYPDVSYNVTNNNITILLPTLENDSSFKPNTNTNTSIPILKTNEYKNTVLPIVVTICGIFLIAILIGLFVFRKYLCTISRFLKKKRKEDMAKKPNQNTISAEDSHNSIVMNQWQGSTAYNRYVPWERDRENQHPQVHTINKNLIKVNFTKIYIFRYLRNYQMAVVQIIIQTSNQMSGIFLDTDLNFSIY